LKVAEIFETLEYGPAPESAAPANEWLDAHGRRFGLFIDGAWREPPRAASTSRPINPASAAVSRTSRRHPPWTWTRRSPPHARRCRRGESSGGHGRARYLYAIARQIQKHAASSPCSSRWTTASRSASPATSTFPLVARHFYHHAGWAQLMETELPGYEPVGVVGQIIPWNFPLLMLAWKIAPALAMGNTVVLKPAEFTSLTALRFAELCDEVGLPKGVVNIITGDGRTGEALVEHPDVDKIAFTGSTEVGRIIRTRHGGHRQEAVARAGRQVAVHRVRRCRPRQRGRRRGRRHLVQPGAGLLRRLPHPRARGHGGASHGQAARAHGTLRVGDPLDKASTSAPSSRPCSSSASTSSCSRASTRAPRMWQPSWSCPQEGCFFPPTLFTDVGPAATIAQVEIFGPVVVLMTFRTHAEAVELANNTRYGLAASVWTENINLALDVAPKLKAGTVWINSTNVFDAASGFGGYRESGFGREGGNRKDVRNAVEAAARATGWSETSGHLRAQILYYVGENLVARADEFAATLHAMTGAEHARREVDASVDRLFHWAAWADKYDGAAHGVPIRGIALAMNEPMGVIGIAAPDEAPLLAFVSLFGPAIAMGNRVVAIPSAAHPLAATDLYQVFETSDLPAGVVNVVTGDREVLTKTLAEHAEVDAMWYFGSREGSKLVEAASIGNLKRTWVSNGRTRDWADPVQGAGHEFLRQATQVKNVWVPYGE
jgi:aldehyde dehydrogenase (NAD+)